MPGNPAPRRRWYQFPLRRSLYATLWMAVGFAAYGASANQWISRGTLELIATLAPFVELGTLFGRPGLGVAVWLWFLIAVIVADSLLNGWVNVP